MDIYVLAFNVFYAYYMYYFVFATTYVILCMCLYRLRDDP